MPFFYTQQTLFVENKPRLRDNFGRRTSKQAVLCNYKIEFTTFAFDERVLDMPYNRNAQSKGLADEPNMGLPAPASDNHESSETADDVIDLLCSEFTWQHIRINQKERVVDLQ